MNYPDLKKHLPALILIISLSLILNAAPYYIFGVNQKYSQSSDATVHTVDWQTFSKNYSGNFDNDQMFKNYQVQPTGILFIGKILVKISDSLGIDPLSWSIFISYLALIGFLTGTYFLAFSATESRLLASVISGVSMIPVISLGLSSWGFMASGFVPKEISLAIAVWLTIIYIKGIKYGSPEKISWFFAMLGLFSNWYPVLFFHYALVMMTAEIIRNRRITKEQFINGIIFLAASPVALYDIFIKAGNFRAPITAIIVDHYAETLQSLRYLILHYLRKQIIYVAIISALWRYGKNNTNEILRPWRAIWISSLFWSLIGVAIEVFKPEYMKYLISRTSVWFYFSSMMMIGMSSYDIFKSKFSQTKSNKLIFALILSAVFISQTSILNVLDGIKDLKNDAVDYNDYIAVVSRLKSVLPTGAIVLSNPDREAKTMRTYGGVGSYVSWKDGNVTLFDGVAAAAWFERYKEAQEAFLSKDFLKIENLARKNHLEYYFYNLNDLQNNFLETDQTVLIKSGKYGLLKLN